MTEAEKLTWAQSCPPEVMQELSRIALRKATESIAGVLRQQARNPLVAGMSGDAALEAAADAIMMTNALAWGGSA